MHVITKYDEEVLVNNRGKLMMMLCDGKVKEERIKCVTEHKNENVKSKGAENITC